MLLGVNLLPPSSLLLENRSMAFFFRLILLGLLSGFFSCQPDPVESLHRDIMRIHDEIMPMTSELAQLALELKQLEERDSMLRAGDRESILRDLGKMDAAEESMMLWMNHYLPPYRQTNLPDEEVLAYLRQQRKQIEGVQKETHTAMEIGRAWMEKFKVK